MRWRRPRRRRVRSTESRPTVVFVDHCAQLSGAEIALSRLVPELAGQIEVVVVLGEEGPLVPRLSAAGVRVIVLPMGEVLRERRKDSAARLRDVWRTAAYAWRLRRLLRDLGADLVHTNSLKAAVYGGLAGRMAGVPVVWHVRDRIAEDYLPVMAVGLVRTLARVVPRAVVVNSRATMATLPRLRRIRVVSDSVAPVVGRGRSANQGPLTFGMIGRLSEWKGQHIFLGAFAEAFTGTEHRARLIGSAMFGEEGYEQRLRTLVPTLGIEAQVDLRGFCDDMDAEYAALDVLVHSSIIPEPFGQVVLEGQAHGLVVIAAAAGGPLEVVTDGVDGLLTPTGDVTALADAMHRVAGDADLRARLSDSAVRNAARFSPAATARSVLSVYAELRPGTFTGRSRL